MCVTSMVMDHYREKWEPYVQTPTIVAPWDPAQITINRHPPISDDEIEEFRKLLERAREYDKRNNEPECEMDEKRKAILTIAKQLGVEIGFL